MSGILNQAFSSVFTNEDITNIPNPPNMYDGNDDDRLEILNITEEEISKYLKSIDANKSTGADMISPRLLKACQMELLLPLKLLFNKSIETRQVPSLWKTANVTPIFKKGCRSIPSNYRPISLTSVLVKILEKILRDKIVSFLDSHNLIKDSQHGFRNKRSCLTNLLEFFDDIYSNWDQRIPSDIIYLDFQKAFDTVPHKILKKKAFRPRNGQFRV